MHSRAINRYTLLLIVMELLAWYCAAAGRLVLMTSFAPSSWRLRWIDRAFLHIEAPSPASGSTWPEVQIRPVQVLAAAAVTSLATFLAGQAWKRLVLAAERRTSLARHRATEPAPEPQLTAAAFSVNVLSYAPPAQRQSPAWMSKTAVGLGYISLLSVPACGCLRVPAIGVIVCISAIATAFGCVLLGDSERDIRDATISILMGAFGLIWCCVAWALVG